MINRGHVEIVDHQTKSSVEIRVDGKRVTHYCSSYSVKREMGALPVVELKMRPPVTLSLDAEYRTNWDLSQVPDAVLRALKAQIEAEQCERHG